MFSLLTVGLHAALLLDTSAAGSYLKYRAGPYLLIRAHKFDYDTMSERQYVFVRPDLYQFLIFYNTANRSQLAQRHDYIDGRDDEGHTTLTGVHARLELANAAAEAHFNDEAEHFLRKDT